MKSSGGIEDNGNMVRATWLARGFRYEYLTPSGDDYHPGRATIWSRVALTRMRDRRWSGLLASWDRMWKIWFKVL